MRKLTALSLLLFLAAACQEPLLDSVPRFLREQDRFSRDAREGNKPGEPGDPEEPGYIPSVYATAFHFRDSVTNLLFFRDGECLLQLLVNSPPDPERHRIWDGHLWTDSTDGHVTIISCDGQEKFRYEGEEHLQGFLLVNGNVHTLGQRPGRDGFCYRINGEAVFDSPRGSVLGSPSDPDWLGGALSLDGENVYYAYSLPIALKDHVFREYHVMRGAQHYKTIPAGSSDALYDLRVHEGQVIRLERRDNALFWVSGEEERALDVSLSEFVSGKLVKFSTSITARVLTRTWGTTCQHWYYIPQVGMFQSVVIGQSERGVLALRDWNWAFADIGPDGRFLKLAYNYPPAPPVPDGDYTLATPAGLFVSNGHFAVALTGSSGNAHVVVSDVGQYSYTFNGYFTSVRME